MYSGNPTERDVEGYVIDPENWNKELAYQLAAEEGLKLGQNHWPILCFMREYWGEHKVAPDVRHVLKHLVEHHGIDKRTAKIHLFGLFPYGYVKQACKIAGMQHPRSWSTS